MFQGREWSLSSRKTRELFRIFQFYFPPEYQIRSCLSGLTRAAREIILTVIHMFISVCILLGGVHFTRLHIFILSRRNRQYMIYSGSTELRANVFAPNSIFFQNNEQSEQRTVRIVQIVQTTNSANSSNCAFNVIN